MKNPRRRRKSTRRRRRNVGISKFTRNPLILSNPRRRSSRRRRRNPMPSFNTMVKDLAQIGGGSAVGAAVNIFLIDEINNMWARQGLRVAGAVAAGIFLPGKWGAAAGGSLMYPLWQDVASRVIGGAGAGATEADLEALAADLEDVIDEVDEEEVGVPDYVW